ncbi:MAG: DUF7507 domain-containing protein, partial [Trebonia sp.]
MPLTSVTIADPSLGPLTCGTAGQPATLHPGDTMTCTGSYTVTAADVSNGSVTDQATAAGVAPDSSTFTATASTTVAMATADSSSPSGVDLHPVSILTLTKNANVQAFANVGDVVDYTLTALNAGTTTLTGVTIADPSLTGFSCSGAPATLAPGATLVCTGTYTVTQDDVNAGLLRHQATATATTPASTNLTATADGFVPIAIPTVGDVQTTLANALNSVIGNGQMLYQPALFQGVTFSAASDAYLAKFDAITLNATTLVTGDEVLYDDGGGTPVGGLTNDTDYWVIKIDDSAIRLAATQPDALAGSAITLLPGATGSAQSFTEADGVNSASFDAGQATLVGGEELQFAAPEGLTDGETVTYDDGGGTPIGGLAQQGVYIVHVIDPS